jgi:hypothetical protein
MNIKRIAARVILCSAFVFVVQPDQAPLAQDAGTSKAESQSVRDGQHDFDFEIGTWKTHLSRRLRPLTGSTTWVEYDGTTIVRKVWNGHANLLELEVDGAKGHIEALSLRLYNPESRQWSLNFSNSAVGTVGIPTIGDFKNGRGEFLIRKRSMAGRSWCDSSSQISH